MNPAAYSRDIQSPTISYSINSGVCNSMPAIIRAFMSSPASELTQFYCIWQTKWKEILLEENGLELRSGATFWHKPVCDFIEVLV